MMMMMMMMDNDDKVMVMIIGVVRESYPAVFPIPLPCSVGSHESLPVLVQGLVPGLALVLVSTHPFNPCPCASPCL